MSQNTQELGCAACWNKIENQTLLTEEGLNNTKVPKNIPHRKLK